MIPSSMTTSPDAAAPHVGEPGGIALDQRGVVALQREPSVAGSSVLAKEVSDGEVLNQEAISGVVVDRIATQTGEDRAFINKDTVAAVAGHVHGTVNKHIGILNDFHAAGLA
jgi:hypothetical protein